MYLGDKAMKKMISAVRRYFCGINSEEKRRPLESISKPSRAIEITENAGVYLGEVYSFLDNLEGEGYVLSWQDEYYRIQEMRGNRSTFYGLTLRGKELVDRL